MVDRVYADPVVVKAGVHRVWPHDLRHEEISRMFEVGFQIHEVAQSGPLHAPSA